MARGTQHRKRRPQANARVAPATSPAAKAVKPAKPARPQAPRWEDQLFFNRLRRHAKWVYVSLALAFAFGFVLLGVGSGSSGIGDALSNFFQDIGGSSGGSSVSSLAKKTQQHPKDATAWRNLATAYEQKNQKDNAISALTTYTSLKPKDTGALAELAGLYLQRASDWETVYQAQEAQSQALLPTLSIAPKTGTNLAKAWSSVANPIETAVQGVAGAAAQNAYSQVFTLLTDRLDTYKKLVKVNPKDANAQYQLAQSASDAGDTATAIAGYTKFLKLAPDDPLAATARKALKQLKSSSLPASG